MDTTMSACSTLQPRRSTGSPQDKWEITGRQLFSRRQVSSPGPRTSTAIPISICTTSPPARLAFPALPKGVNSPGRRRIPPSPRRLAPALQPQRPNRSRRPVGLRSLPTGKSHQVTHSLVAGVRSEDMVEPFLVHYPSKDGKWTISAFVYVPYNMARNGQQRRHRLRSRRADRADGESRSTASSSTWSIRDTW